MANLEQEAVTDPLTGVFNRRHLDRQIREEVGKAHRYALPLSVMLVDVDHFKAVNDTFGHEVGDIVLRNLARLMVSIVRNWDIVARYGGEEIVIVAPNTALTSAATLAERLRRAVADAELAAPDERTGYQSVRVTISIGVTELSPVTNDAAALLKKADRAMYSAKHEGRNRVVSRV